MTRQANLRLRQCRCVSLSRECSFSTMYSYSIGKMNGHELISHQTGATLLVLFDQTIEFTPISRFNTNVQNANEQAPTFQVWNMPLDKEMSTSMHPMKFAMGTRGKVGSISLLPVLIMGLAIRGLYAHICARIKKFRLLRSQISKRSRLRNQMINVF